MNKPLEGLFVVELTTYWAAPSAGEFLRCLGARVVKIETGKAGDSVRYWGRTCGMPIEANENPSFDLFNGGKEFMHMDLNDPEHERVLHNMLAKADVFLTSMRLGGLKKHNLDYDTLKEKYPRLVMAHATGYGCKDGPLSAAPGLDAVAFFAMNGLISDLRLNPDDSPICPPTGMGDLTTGMPLFGAMVASLVLTTAVIEIPFLANAFGFTPIGFAEYATSLALAFSIIPIVEIIKVVQRAAAKRKVSR